MADWQTISSLATAAGTLVLATATFSAVRSANRSARVAEQSLLTAMRPLLLPSSVDDPVQKVLWQDRHVAHVGGGRAVVEEQDGVIYLALGIRNVGSGLALPQLQRVEAVPEGVESRREVLTRCDALTVSAPSASCGGDISATLSE